MDLTLRCDKYIHTHRRCSISGICSRFKYSEHDARPQCYDDVQYNIPHDLLSDNVFTKGFAINAE